MESCGTPKTSPRWRKRKLLKEEAEAARRKRHCKSPVGTSHDGHESEDPPETQQTM